MNSAIKSKITLSKMYQKKVPLYRVLLVSTSPYTSLEYGDILMFSGHNLSQRCNKMPQFSEVSERIINIILHDHPVLPSLSAKGCDALLKPGRQTGQGVYS